MELPMLHDHSRNSTYDAVMAGKYSHIRLMEMGKNKLRDGSGVDGNDHLIVPPTQGDSMADGQLSRWLAPAVGNYSNINCRMELGKLPAPADQNTPCPECCSQGQWDSSGPQDNQTWHWTADEQWFGNTMVGFSAACLNFACVHYSTH
jgi:hypothetical protein